MSPPNLQRLLVPRTRRADRLGRVDRRGRRRGTRTRLSRRDLAHASDARIAAGAPLFPFGRRSAGAPDSAFIAAPNHEVPAIAAALARRGAGGFVCFSAGFSETATPAGQRLRGNSSRRGHAAVPRPELLRHGEFLRPRRAVAGPGGRRIARARRGADLPERHDCAHADVQRPVAADRLPDHRRQPDAARRRGPDRRARATIRVSPRSACTSRASRTRRSSRARSKRPGRTASRSRWSSPAGPKPPAARRTATRARCPAATPCSTPSARRPASPAARRCRRCAKR